MDVITTVFAHSTKLHDPRFMGHQVATPLPLAALADGVAALLNNSAAIFEMGPAAVAMERAVLRLLTEQLGFSISTSSGVLVEGGSIGNLTALLAARQAAAGFDVWRQGLQGRRHPPLSIVVAESTHYSIARAARIMGLGDDGCVGVAVDDQMRLDPKALEAALLAEKKRGRRVLAVVASAGSTAAGAIDPIDTVADLCAAHGTWLHVDGAHGGALLFSPEEKKKLRGIERADSVVIDFHKMLMMPALCTAVVFKDGKAGAGAFAQDAGYLFADDDDAWSDIGRRTIECTKPMLALKVYATLQAFGTELFTRHVEESCARARRMAELIVGRPELELLVTPDTNIVCFRARGPFARGSNPGANAAIRKAIVEEGRRYFVQVHLHGTSRDGLWLRCSLQNPHTREEHLVALLDEVVNKARAT